MLGDGLPDAFDTRGSSRPRTETAVQSTTSIWHCRAPAGAAASIPCPTPWRLGEIARRIAISQPAAPLIMGCFISFSDHPPPPPALKTYANPADNPRRKRKVFRVYMKKHRVELSTPAARTYGNLRSLAAGERYGRELLRSIDEIIDEEIRSGPYTCGRKLYGSMAGVSLEGIYWISRETLHIFYEASVNPSPL